MQLQTHTVAHCLYEEIEALADAPLRFEHVTPPWNRLSELARGDVGRDFVTVSKDSDRTKIVKALASILTMKARKGPTASVFAKGEVDDLDVKPKRLALFVKRHMVFPLYGKSKKLTPDQKAHLEKINSGKLDITKVDGGYKLTLSGMKG